MKYWYYCAVKDTFNGFMLMKNTEYVWGVQNTTGEDFNFSNYYKQYKDFVLVFVKEISENQYNNFSEIINQKNNINK